jgi:alpha-N-acetylglucosamine transferase
MDDREPLQIPSTTGEGTKPAFSSLRFPSTSKGRRLWFGLAAFLVVMILFNVFYFFINNDNAPELDAQIPAEHAEDKSEQVVPADPFSSIATHDLPTPIIPVHEIPTPVIPNYENPTPSSDSQPDIYPPTEKLPDLPPPDPGRNYSREAYVTLLTPPHPHPWTVGQPDYYFEATKVKAHRLLRNPTTRDPYGRPFIVLVTPEVPIKQIGVLESHGVIVKRVETIPPPDGHVHLALTNPRYVDQFTKLHIWNMTDYDRIAFLDADTLLIRPVHAIFDTPPSTTDDGEEFLFAAVYDSGSKRWDERYNPGPDDKGELDSQLNAGVFFLWPTERQRDYIFNVYHNPPDGADWTRFMEQDMLRWAYRETGHYPWTRLSHLYNTQWCRAVDLSTAYVLHDKLWGDTNSPDEELRRVWYQAWGEMVGWDAPRSELGILNWQDGLGICHAWAREKEDSL